MGARRLEEPDPAGRGKRLRGVRDGIVRLARALAVAALLPAFTMVRAAPARAEHPVIAVGPLMLAEPGAETPLAIQVGPAASIPPKSYLRIRGLPRAAELTEGHAIAPGAWAVPLAGLAMLRIRVPAGLEARSDVAIALVDVDGNILNEARSALVVASAAALARRPEAPLAGATPAAAAPPPPPEPPERATGTPQLTEQFRAALRMLIKGDELIAAGNFASARLYYQRAAEMGLARGALALAGTYDALELQRRRAVGVQPDAELARQWYERARELGEPEAVERLSRLGPR